MYAKYLIKTTAFPVITLLLIYGVLFLKNEKITSDLYQGYEKIEYTLKGKKLSLLVADTPEKREKGLMYYRELKGVDGMIFIFPQKQMLNFWNRNTFMDLHVYWINEEQIVGKSFLPSIEKSKDIVTINSPQAVDKVIEIPER